MLYRVLLAPQAGSLFNFCKEGVEQAQQDWEGCMRFHLHSIAIATLFTSALIVISLRGPMRVCHWRVGGSGRPVRAAALPPQAQQARAMASQTTLTLRDVPARYKVGGTAVAAPSGAHCCVGERS